MASKARRPASTEELADVAERLDECVGVVGTRAHASDVAGISPQHLHNMITGACAPSFTTLARLSKASGYRLDWLATGEGPRRFDVDVDALRLELAQTKAALIAEVQAHEATRGALARCRAVLGDHLATRALEVSGG